MVSFLISRTPYHLAPWENLLDCHICDTPFLATYPNTGNQQIMLYLVILQSFLS